MQSLPAADTTSAWDELINFLDPGEKVEAIVLGAWGYDEPDPPPVPANRQGVILTPEAARSLMVGWSFEHGFGLARCYPAYIWTNQRVIWVEGYDGATGLQGMPRHPSAEMPVIIGGGC